MSIYRVDIIKYGKCFGTYIFLGILGSEIGVLISILPKKRCQSELFLEEIEQI